MAITQSDFDRIMHNINVVASAHFDNGNFRTGFKTIALAVQDAWISSHELKWARKRKRHTATCKRVNFEHTVKTTINKL